MDFESIICLYRNGIFQISIIMTCKNLRENHQQDMIVKKRTSVEEHFWDQRYLEGGTSGLGSIGKIRDFKWSVIDKYLPYLHSVVDVGCGDLSFWEGRDCEDYTGIDISKTIIEKNKILRPDWSFICANSEKTIEGLKKEVVFCFDVLFHIMNTETYIQTLKNLCYYSKNYIFIYTWRNNPFKKYRQIKKFIKALFTFNVSKVLVTLKHVLSNNSFSDGNYQYFRFLENEIEIFNKYGFDLNEIVKYTDDIGALYVFKRARKTFPDLYKPEGPNRYGPPPPEP